MSEPVSPPPNPDRAVDASHGAAELASLAQAWRDYVPQGDRDADLEGLLRQSADLAVVDVDVPVGSRLPGGGAVKELLRRSQAWYLNYLANQITALGQMLVRVDRVLVRRLAVLERTSTATDPALERVRADLDPTALPVGAAQSLIGLLTPCPRRVLVATCGDGAILAALEAAGFDAYGLEPQRPMAATTLRHAWDVRDDLPLDHLAAVSDGALGAVVLRGHIDTLSTAAQLRLLDEALRAVGRGGQVAVLAVDPDQWASRHGLWVALGAGRPLGAGTWAHLFVHRGLTARVAQGEGFSWLVGIRS